MYRLDLKDENALITFLHLHGIQAIPPNNAEPYYLQAWNREGDNQFTCVALFQGYFYLAILEKGFGLFVYNEKEHWYNLVWFWDANVSEDDFVQGLREIVFSHDIHSFDSYVWICVRKTTFESEWQKIMNGVETQNISPELKEIVFEFSESLIETPNLSKCKQAILNLLTLFTVDDLRNSNNLKAMQRYFPPRKYERWNLPDKYKRILDEIGYYFEADKIPSQTTVRNLIRETKSLNF